MAHAPKLWKLVVRFTDEEATDIIYGTEQQMWNLFCYLLGYCVKPKDVEIYDSDRRLQDSGQV